VPADEVRLATRTALTNLVDAAIAEEVAFVVIAGDLYDGDWPHFGTGLFFCAAMGRLDRAGIEVFLLYGNHDAESVLTKKLPLPANVHSFGTRKATTLHAATGAALHGWSYREKDTSDNLAAAYPAALPNRLNIGVLHTALSGRPPHAPYAPCTPQELASKGYDYWALGHVHDFEIVSNNPLIVFPGNIQGRSIRETGPKGAVLVTVEDDRIVGAPLQIHLDAVRWAHIEIDIGDVESESDLHARLGDGLRLAYSAKADGRPLVVRVTLSGATSLHGDLGRRRDVLREEVRAVAVAISDRLWVEKVVLNTEPYSATDQQDPALRDELGAILAQGIADDGLADQVRADLADFFSRTPPDLGGDEELLARVRQGDVATLISDAAAALNTRLGEIG
jgi:DNA repair protein SbcD/Mre11